MNTGQARVINTGQARVIWITRALYGPAGSLVWATDQAGLAPMWTKLGPTPKTLIIKK
jgi:hypothetical protein